eukprot:COSAG06_NODE_968_length_11280_cov_125.578302_1_plen_119_part_00
MRMRLRLRTRQRMQMRRRMRRRLRIRMRRHLAAARRRGRRMRLRLGEPAAERGSCRACLRESGLSMKLLDFFSDRDARAPVAPTRWSESATLAAWALCLPRRAREKRPTWAASRYHWP